MATPEGCPCDAVREIKELVERHERQLNEGNVQFALIQQDLGWIKARIDKKDKFNSNIVASVIQTICALLMAYIAAKVGLA